jgi:hypothetical protein
VVHRRRWLSAISPRSRRVSSRSRVPHSVTVRKSITLSGNVNTGSRRGSLTMLITAKSTHGIWVISVSHQVLTPPKKNG